MGHLPVCYKKFVMPVVLHEGGEGGCTGGNNRYVSFHAWLRLDTTVKTSHLRFNTDLEFLLDLLLLFMNTRW